MTAGLPEGACKLVCKGFWRLSKAACAQQLRQLIPCCEMLQLQGASAGGLVLASRRSPVVLSKLDRVCLKDKEGSETKAGVAGYPILDDSTARAVKSSALCVSQNCVRTTGFEVSCCELLNDRLKILIPPKTDACQDYQPAL